MLLVKDFSFWKLNCFTDTFFYLTYHQTHPLPTLPSVTILALTLSTVIGLADSKCHETQVPLRVQSFLQRRNKREAVGTVSLMDCFVCLQDTPANHIHSSLKMDLKLLVIFHKSIASCRQVQQSQDYTIIIFIKWSPNSLGITLRMRVATTFKAYTNMTKICDTWIYVKADLPRNATVLQMSQYMW